MSYHAARGGVLGRADPYAIDDIIFLSKNVYQQTAGLTIQNFTANPARKTLVLMVGGQSNWTNVTPSVYVPNSAVLQLNVYNGAIYNIVDKVLSNSDEQSPYGPGSIISRVADKLLTANGGTFDNVIISNTAIGGTVVADWATGTLVNRQTVALRRLSDQGLTPTTPGVTFAYLWGQGEGDNSQGTSQSAYASGLTTHFNNVIAGGFSGRFFICEETWSSGTVSTAVQNAQIGKVDNIIYFSGGNLDSLNATNRIADNTHFNDTGAAAAATLVFNAMHASGAPY